MSTPRHLLLLKPGFAPERLEAALPECGLARVVDAPTDRWQSRRFSDGAKVPSEVEYGEDATLGQRHVYIAGPRAEELREFCAAHWPCWSAAEIFASATAAQTPAEQVATLAPLAALLESDAAQGPQVSAVLHTRLAEGARPAVRRAALLVAASLPAGHGVALLQAMVDDLQLSTAARSYLAASAAARSDGRESAEVDDPLALQQRAAVAMRDKDSVGARRLLDRALELAPLDGAAYFLRAQLSAAEGRSWLALLDVTTALAVARRHGVSLQAMQELQSSVKAQLLTAATPPTAAFELQAVAQLALLLRHGRQHEVEEVAEAMLTLPGRAPLWWLTVGLARWDRGRPDRAVAALQTALAGEPHLPAARFLLGQCHRALGHLEAALHDFALLDPVPGERPAQPSLLTAYADELLGTQAPWEAREHAFDRVLLLRESGRVVEALAVITALLHREPAAADALLAQGILFAELQQPAAALLVLDQALAALRPEERLLADEDPLATVQQHRAAVLFALGDKEGAAAARRAAHRLGGEPAAPSSEHPPEPAAAPAAHASELAAHENSAAAYAELRRIAQQTLLDESGAALSEDATPGTLEPAVARVALREQMAALLVAALRALDTHADAAACRVLIERARAGFQALGQLAPALVSTPAVRQLVDDIARVLGVADSSTDPS